MDRSILKCNYIQNTPKSKKYVDTPIFQSFNDIPRYDSVLSQKISFIEFDFDGTQKIGNYDD